MENNLPIEVIVWDWNGTLLNDVDICVEAMNRLLFQRNLPLLNHQTYNRIFTFPVQDYYLAAGFDFSSEPFEIPAMQFMNEYFELLPSAILNHGCVDLLNLFSSKKYRQIILSAMEQQSLNESLHNYGLLSYFEHVSGAGDHYARGKAQQGIKLMEQMNVDPERVLLIGDTLHDFEVSQMMGCQCVLVAKGHQDYQRLKGCSTLVVNDFAELVEICQNW